MINENRMRKGNELPMKSEKTRTPIKFISLIIWGIQLVLTVLLSISIVKVGVLPTMLLAAVFAVVWIMAAVTGVLTLAGWKKKKKGLIRRVIACILAVIMIITSVIGYRYIITTNKTLENISGITVEKESVSVYVLKDDLAESIQDTAGYRYGILGETDRENTELTEFEMILCARPGVKYVLEYDERGEFGKTAGAQELDWPEDFYRNYAIPTEGYPCTIALDVAGGYALEQSTVSVNLGASYELPVPVRYNYAFVGWYSLPGGEGIRYTGSDGKSYENWSEPADRTLYAHWTSTVGQVNLGQIELRSQEIYSQKSEPFSIGLDIEALRSAGYRYLNIGIAGLCSGYDYRMNERGRYFVLSDVLGGDLLVWSFKVKNFSGVDGQNIALDSLNANGQYQLQLVSDKSPAYDEKLTVSSLVITIKAVK